METVSVGRTVHYRLSASDVEQLSPKEALPPAESNNQHEAGQVVPALVVRVFDENAGTSNLRVFVDGNAVLWKTSVTYGGSPGQWSWPPRQEPERGTDTTGDANAPQRFGGLLPGQIG